MKCLELGIVPIRFEVMKRKILFLQYILQQEKDSMAYNVFQATAQHSFKNDFVKVYENPGGEFVISRNRRNVKI